MTEHVDLITVINSIKNSMNPKKDSLCIHDINEQELVERDFVTNWRNMNWLIQFVNRYYGTDFYSINAYTTGKAMNEYIKNVFDFVENHICN